ncbi:MAG: hypothetical protein C4617_00955 [Candidatus Liberibacter europaeus]|uniref:LPS-assembly lipoprotein n=1 Tax=Candidatus Liberibacter europaeus TaxID=744859 RepID=A0A2T4VZ14_9HYPH|nr:hypothetical protein [Candidatus Liberibacter europaeus]PTL87005.1 MAG: hypothetical protein C4617_00955 [Candidatus Liberibacter europaeus]
MLYSKNYILYLIITFYNCFCLVGCQIYPLYYTCNKRDKGYVNPITISISVTPIKQELYNNLNFLLSHVLTKNKYLIKINADLDKDQFVSNQGLFGNTGRISIQADYSVKAIAEKKILFNGHTNVTSTFDFSYQKFSKERIMKDKEKKSIKELAENISTDVITLIKSID